MSERPVYVRCPDCGHTVERACGDKASCPRWNATRLTRDRGVGRVVCDEVGVNPKDLVGHAKVDMSLFPPAGVIHAAHAMMDGAIEYGPYNWRDKRVRAMVYSAAAKRHIEKWQDREDIDPKSGANHLGHAIACLAIVLDAQGIGMLVDDRPPSGCAAKLLDVLNEQILERAKQREDRE